MIKQIVNFRIPSLVGILLLLIGVGMTSYLVEQGIIFEGRAAQEKTPSNIAITNVTPTSFTVMYTTQEPVPGTLSYGTEKDGTNVALDDRNASEGRSTPFTVHQITVRNLRPATTYYFKIISGDAVFLNNNEPYVVKTASELAGSLPPRNKDIEGSVRFPDNGVKQDLLVLLTSAATEPRSALLNADGSYTISLSSLRTKDLSSFATLSDETIFELQILSNTQVSTAKVLYKNAQPVPLIMFGQTYDFTISTDPIPTTASSSAQFPATGEAAASQGEIEILSPKQEETFTDQRPVFEGIALPGEEVEVVINSEDTLQATVTANNSGAWSYRPPTPLTPGKHTITIRTRDISGVLREFTRSFTVYAQGSQFIEPSILPTRTPTPTLSRTSPTPTPTAEPTAVPTPTPIPATATPVPLASVSATPVPTLPQLPPTGSREVALGGIIGLGTLALGLIVFFLTRGSLL